MPSTKHMTLNGLIKELQVLQEQGHGRKYVVAGCPKDPPYNPHTLCGVTMETVWFMDDYWDNGSHRDSIVLQLGRTARY